MINTYYEICEAKAPDSLARWFDVSCQCVISEIPIFALVDSPTRWNMVVFQVLWTREVLFGLRNPNNKLSQHRSTPKIPPAYNTSKPTTVHLYEGCTMYKMLSSSHRLRNQLLVKLDLSKNGYVPNG